jgi:serine/threonine protein kinase
MDTVRASQRESETAELRTVADVEATLVLGRYKLGRRLGSGAFATVYAAHDERLDRPVAIKVLARERVIHSRFEREARAAARLHHPGIVTLFEAAVDDEGAYLVSELVKGTTLDRALELGELSDRDILAVAIAVADALEHAHANDVVHRDVKPQNVLIPAAKARRGTSAAVAPAKLTDFGVARVVGRETLTRAGDVIGTLAYMSPEQAEGRESGESADLFSLALITYEALTGVNPVADQLRQGRHRRMGTYLPPIRRQRGDLPRRLGAAIDQALRPRPSERGSVADFAIALTDALELVDDTPGVVAPAKAITITRRPDSHPQRPAEDRPGPEWSANPANPRQRPIPALEPTAQSRTQTLELAPGGLLLLAAGLLAVPLGFIGLAGVWPALLSQTVRGFWRRAILAAAGFAALGTASGLAPHNFYYHLDPVTLSTLKPAAIGAAIWALAAALSPWLTRGVRPRLDLALITVIAAGVPAGLTAAGLHHIAGLVPGALIGWLIAAHRPLIRVIRDSVASRSLS